MFGTSSNDYGTAITQGTDGVIYLGGYTSGSTMMGRGNNGANDAYMLPQSNKVTLTSTSPNAAASVSPDLFQFTSGNYTATITGGFAYGDRLAFPTGYNTLSIVNTDPTDGNSLCSRQKRPSSKSKSSSQVLQPPTILQSHQCLPSGPSSVRQELERSLHVHGQDRTMEPKARPCKLLLSSP
ncbi:MAG: hypothetical protein EBX68_09460 [Betaproteobacteria bacterium]|nr:hypothetical protein [Betaproteobacteria bacterium]